MSETNKTPKIRRPAEHVEFSQQQSKKEKAYDIEKSLGVAERNSNKEKEE